MKAAARQLRIRELLGSRDFVDLSLLVRELDSSESSVRRDLAELEKRNLLRRVHGGAVALSRNGKAEPARVRSAEKHHIASVVAGLIEDGQTVILDGGTTTAAVAEELVHRPLHIITNSLLMPAIFRESRDVELTLAGGYVYPRLDIVLGPLCESMLAGVNADVLVMGIGGITEKGLSNNNTLVVGSELKMIEVARKVIVAADSSKFGRDAMVHLAPLEIVDIVVSDSGLSPEYRELLRRHDVELLLA